MLPSRFTPLPLVLCLYGAGLLLGLGHVSGLAGLSIFLVARGREKVLLFLALSFLAGVTAGRGQKVEEAFLRRTPQGSVLITGVVEEVGPVGVRLILAEGVRVELIPPFGWAAAHIRTGDTLVAAARWSGPEPSLNPGSPDPLGWLRSQNVRAQANITARLLRLDRTDPEPARNASLPQTLARRVERRFPTTVAPWVRAMVFGDRSSLPEKDLLAFRRSGLAHLLAVSGLHVGILFGAVSLLTMSVAARLPGSRKLKTGLSGGLLVFFGLTYGVLLGWPPSATRALLMLLLAWGFRHTGRPGWLGRTWSWALFLFLVVHPAGLIHDLGTQLSFAAVGGLCGARFLVPDRLRAFPRVIAGSIAAGVTAFLATTPLILKTIGWVPLGSVLTGLVGIPLTTLFLLVVFSALITPVGGSVLAAAASLLLEMLLGWAHWSASSWHPVLLASPNGWMWWSVVSACVVLVSLAKGSRVLRIMTAVILLALGPRVFPPDRLVVTLLDVGQGEAIVLEGPGLGILVVDTGPGASAGTIIDRYLAFRQAQHVEVWLSHADRDHTGGMERLRELRPDVAVRASWKDRIFTGEPLLAGRRFSPAPDVRMFVLHPGQAGKENDDSNVWLLVLPRLLVLLTGDMTAAIETHLARHWQALWQGNAVRILKAAHHGSSTSSSPAMLRSYAPDLVLLSAGKDNPFGHPHPDVVERFESASIPWFGTQGRGALQLRWNGRQFTVYRWKDGSWNRVSRISTRPGTTVSAR